MRRFRGKSVRRSRTSPKSTSRRQGRFHAKERKRSRRRVTPQRNPKGSVSGAQGKVPLYERKPSRRIRDRYGAQADMRRRSDLLSSFLTETHERFQENNAERTIVREHCCLELICRRTGCSPSRWRSRQCEHRKSAPDFRAEHCNRREET